MKVNTMRSQQIVQRPAEAIGMMIETVSAGVPDTIL